tara:strand:+ start:11869 stop:12159 length:291 start_codon:yes stop_codon:yes gene_type:complete
MDKDNLRDILDYEPERTPIVTRPPRKRFKFPEISFPDIYISDRTKGLLIGIAALVLTFAAGKFLFNDDYWEKLKTIEMDRRNRQSSSSYNSTYRGR